MELLLELDEGFVGTVVYDTETEKYTLTTEHKYCINDQGCLFVYRFDGDRLLSKRISAYTALRTDKAKEITNSSTRAFVGEEVWSRVLANPELVPMVAITDSIALLQENEPFQYGVFLEEEYVRLPRTELEADTADRLADFREEHRYNFRFGIGSFYETGMIPELSGMYVIEGSFVGRLTDFIEDGKYLQWQYNDIVKAAGKEEEMKSIQRRLYREALPIAPLPLPELVSDWHSCYILTQEYIAVDEETSFYGNIEIDGVECCCVSISYYKPYDVSPYEQMREKLADKVSSGDYETEVEILRELVSSVLDKERFPYQIQLSGNDDDSWSKGFWTLEEAWEEYMYLLQVAPINKPGHVTERGYYFSN